MYYNTHIGNQFNRYFYSDMVFYLCLTKHLLQTLELFSADREALIGVNFVISI